ncbi:MAG: NlpC/P60 family protein, partial [Spirochaetaceae bacterium]
MRNLIRVLSCSLLIAVTIPAAAIDVQTSILAVARDYQGSGYCTGGIAPPCFDCSGFVQRVYRPVVPDLPRISRDQARVGVPVDRSELRAGDLVFFATGTIPGAITHVAIYMGQDSIIHAISNGPNRGVNVTPLSGGYWERRFVGARRVLPDADRTGSVDEQEAIEFARGTYTGELVDGEPHGRGSMIMRNGDRYAGQFVSGLFEGQGVYVWQNGDRYEGQFRAGEMHGQGRFTRSGGSVTTGEWDMGRY